MSGPAADVIRGYQLRERLGAGGFGVVYRAFQPAVDREVAVKVVLPEFANHPDFIRRFQLEAQIVARLEHLHIVPLYDYWREPDGAYLVMRFLRGGSLRGALERGPLDVEGAQRLVEQVTQALGAAHRQHVIHRDIKPENILLDDDGNFYLTDFGIAKDLLHESDATRTGAITGSPGYMSPEQVTAAPLTPQSDLYSLGVLVFEALAGRHPFEGATVGAQIAKHLSEPLPSLRAFQPHLPLALEDVIQAATAKSPEARYPDARSFAAAFRHAFSGAVSRSVTLGSLAPVDLVNPYKGLRAFEAADAADFFGRDALVERLLARLANEAAPDAAVRFLAVVGPSGSGKSSVVKAGLLPALRRGALPGSARWFVVEMVPGTHPLDELEIGLLRVAADRPAGLMEQLRRDERGLLRAARLAVPADDGELLLVIDQFEELFTGHADRGETEHLLRMVRAAVTDPRSRVRVVITLRADFYDRPLMHPEFSRLMQPRTEVVLPLSATELTEAICKPAERAGAEIEPGLVEAIVADVREQPGALPMLQYALTELFERREGRTLSKAAYEATGRVSGALARRADEVFARLTDVEQAAARQLFLRLVTLGEGTEDTRRRTLHGELKALDVDQSALEAAVQAFGRSRLLLFDRDPVTREPTVEVAHEALLREWRRLREWLDESRADVRMQRLLGSAAREWVQAQRDPSFLLRGTRLAQFEGWAAGRRVALSQDERSYLEASTADRVAQEAEEKARHQRELEAARQVAEAERRRAAVQAEAARRLKGRAWGLAALALVAVVLAAAAFQARATAARAAAVNHSLVLASNAREQIAVGDTDLALSLALEAVRTPNPPPEALRGLSEVAQRPGTRGVLVGHANRVLAVAFSPDARLAASASCAQAPGRAGCPTGELMVWDVASRKPLHRYPLLPGWVTGLAFSQDQQALLSASSDGTLVLTSLDTGALIRRFEKTTGAITALAVSDDRGLAITGSDEGSVTLWNLATGVQVRRSAGHQGGVTTVAFSPPCAQQSGECRQTALSGGADKNIVLWDVATGQTLRTMTGHADVVTAVGYLPGGQYALSVSRDLSLRKWELATGSSVQSQRFPGVARNMVVSRDGSVALLQMGSGVLLWDVAGWRQEQTLAGHAGEVDALAISPDQRYAMSAGADKTVRLWNVKGPAEMRRLPAPGVFPVAIRSSADGRQLLTGGAGGGALLDAERGFLLRMLPADYHVSPGAAAFSPNGRLALLGTSGVVVKQPGKGQLALFDTASGQLLRSFAGHKFPVRAVAWGPGGQVALSGSQSSPGLQGELILWDVASGGEVRRFDTRSDTTSIAFSTDGRRAVTGSASQGGRNSPTLWDVATGRAIRHFDGHRAPVYAVAFGPGDRSVISASVNSTAIQWDAETGAVIRRFTSNSGLVALDVGGPARRYALFGAMDGAVIQWDLSGGEQVDRLGAHAQPVFGVAFGHDGRTAFSVSGDGTIIQWRVADWSLPQLTEWVRANRFVRELTCDERARYRVEPLCR